MKYYAVKNGRKPGIYRTWDDCRAQVIGYSGAEYKSFAALADAEEFIGIGETAAKPPSSDTVRAYVDGSYNAKTGVFAYGAVLITRNGEETFSESFDDAALAAMHNVAGEIKGAEFMIRLCAERGISDVEIYYDYEGIAAWALGKWKTNKDATRAYKKFYDGIKDSVSVRFIKVKGHSGDKYNDMADALAKAAAGIEA